MGRVLWLVVEQWMQFGGGWGASKALLPTSPTNGLAGPPRASTEPPCPQLGSGVPFGRQSPPTILAQPWSRHAQPRLSKKLATSLHKNCMTNLKCAMNKTCENTQTNQDSSFKKCILANKNVPFRLCKRTTALLRKTKAIARGS